MSSFTEQRSQHIAYQFDKLAQKHYNVDVGGIAMTVRGPSINHGVNIGVEQMEMKAIFSIISTCCTSQTI